MTTPTSGQYGGSEQFGDSGQYGGPGPYGGSAQSGGSGQDSGPGPYGGSDQPNGPGPDVPSANGQNANDGQWWAQQPVQTTGAPDAQGPASNPPRPDAQQIPASSGYPQAPYQNPGYQAPPPYPAQDDYRQSPYTYQPYPAPGMFPAASGYPPLSVAPTRPWGGLGLVSMICGLVALVAGIAITLVMSHGFSSVLSTLPSGTSTIDTTTLTPDQQDQVTRAGAAAIGMFVPSLVGLGALVLGIVAVSKQRGKSAGAVGIVLAVLAPIACVIVLVSTLGNALSRLGG